MAVSGAPINRDARIMKRLRHPGISLQKEFISPVMYAAYSVLIEHRVNADGRQKAPEEGGYICSWASARGDRGDVFRAAANLWTADRWLQEVYRRWFTETTLPWEKKSRLIVTISLTLVIYLCKRKARWSGNSLLWEKPLFFQQHSQK